MTHLDSAVLAESQVAEMQKELERWAMPKYSKIVGSHDDKRHAAGQLASGIAHFVWKRSTGWYCYQLLPSHEHEGPRLTLISRQLYPELKGGTIA